MIKKEKINLDHTFAEYSLIDLDDVDTSKLRFIIQDIVDLIRNNGIKIDKIAIIDYFRVEPKKRDQMYGTVTIRRLVDRIKATGYGKVILLQSYALKADYPTEPTEEELSKILIKQAKFFELNGFRNINSLCCFESSIPYMYIDEDSAPVLEEILKIEIK